MRCGSVADIVEKRNGVLTYRTVRGELALRCVGLLITWIWKLIFRCHIGLNWPNAVPNCSMSSMHAWRRLGLSIGLRVVIAYQQAATWSNSYRHTASYFINAYVYVGPRYRRTTDLRCRARLRGGRREVIMSSHRLAWVECQGQATRTMRRILSRERSLASVDHWTRHSIWVLSPSSRSMCV